MAAEGLRFSQCYAGSTVCAPSRCCLMTGYHTGHALIRGNGRGALRPGDVTVAKVLKRAGYATGIIGKWGLGEAETTGIPNRQGFDYWFGYLNQTHAHNYYPEFLWRNTEKVPLRNEVSHIINGQDRSPSGVATKRVEYSHDLFAAEALSFVEKNKGEPFFLYLAFTIPHANNEAGNKGMEVPSCEPYENEPWPEPQKGHAAMITRMDRDIGRLFAKLKQLGIDQQTVVFFSSDNGPHKEGGGDPEFFHSSGPLRGFKRSLHDGGIRVPMIVRWPGKIKAGASSDLPWAFWDFLPTAAELAGVGTGDTSAPPREKGSTQARENVPRPEAESPPGLDGISVVPTLLGQGEQRRHEFLYWEFHEGGSKQAVRTGDWKAVRLTPGGPIQLYDLRSDIGESRDLSAEHPDVVAKIEAYLKTARTESAEWPLQAGPARKAETVVKATDDASLQAALRSARPGTRIQIAPGRYRPGVYAAKLKGTEREPIVIEGADAEDPPEFQGGGEAWHLSGCAFVTLRNIAVRGQSANGINVDDGGTFETPAHHIVLEKLRISDVGPRGNFDALKMSGVDDFVVRDCRFEGWGGQAPDMVGCHRGLIENCRFVGKPGFSQDTGPQMKGGSSQIVIRRCLFLDAAGRAVNLGGSTGLAFFRPRGAKYEAKDITVEGCTFVGCEAPVAFVGVDGAVVRYSSFYRPKKWVVRILQETTAEGFAPCRNGRFEHNLIVFRQADVNTFVNIGPHTQPETFRFADNWWFCEDRPAASTPKLPAAETGGIYGIDPRPTAPDRHDFTPREPKAAAFGAGAWK
jgi:arylsulfatase A-like enzyme